MTVPHYLLWASGEDRPGIVSAVTRALFQIGANLEDSSMMRLGSEFGIFVIFTTRRAISDEKFGKLLQPIKKKLRLAVGVKPLSTRQAAFRVASERLHLVSIHGPDRPGIVYRATDLLAKRGFNITDLSTHRTTTGPRAGYILLIEGEVRSKSTLAKIRRDLSALQRRLRTKVDIRPVGADAL
ncbi:MAG: ACT domain-containing protein [Elusimicrobia bacterium]|nr:ACT domain-containing protein [Elusimicrobiota bacterium]